MEEFPDDESAYSFYHEGSCLRELARKLYWIVQLPSGLMLRETVIRALLIHCACIVLNYYYGFLVFLSLILAINILSVMTLQVPLFSYPPRSDSSMLILV